MKATTTFSKFSIDHILRPGFGPTPPPALMHTVGYTPDGYFHGPPRELACLDYNDVGRVSVPRPSAAPYLDSYPTYGMNGLHHAGLSLFPNCVHTVQNRHACFPMNTGRQSLAHVNNCYQQQQQQQDASESSQPPQTSRMRTVFTVTQIKHLDKLFEVTDYPDVETRAELARNIGLTEETVRVWFKNRRARRKKKQSCSRVDTSPCSRPSAVSRDTGLH